MNKEKKIMQNSTIYNDTTERHLHKYNNRNIVQRYTLYRFFNMVAFEIKRMNAGNVLDFGCGEGLFLQQLTKRGVGFKNLTGIDLRDDSLQYARALHPNYDFIKKDLLSWDCEPEKFDLVIASQVMEHMHNPEEIIIKLISLSSKYLLVTVPWEPWFRLMNLIRGRDIFRLGNHPEHINLWSLRRFKKFVSKFIHIEKAFTIFPFIIVIGKK